MSVPTMIPANSSWIAGYNYVGGNLYVMHVSGTVFKGEVPADVACAFVEAESKGTFYNQNIRHQFKMLITD